MTTREKAHKLLDELPESELEPVVEILASRGKNGTASSASAKQPKKVGRLSFSAIGASDAPDVSERFDEYLGRAIDPTADDAMLVGHEAAMDRLRAHPEQWAAWQAEIAELDGTLADGLSEL